jgi:hypothetical protein
MTFRRISSPQILEANVPDELEDAKPDYT